MDENALPNWRGINHLALVTPDMDATVRFWHGALGARLVATLAVGPMRHYFFQIGPQNTVAFFEWSNADITTYQKPAGIPPDFPTQFDHVSFNVADEDALHHLQDRLRASRVEVTEVVDHGFLHSIYFNDPNGIALEASWWVKDPTSGEPDLDDQTLFGDPYPVPAVEEIIRDGRVASIPATRLTGDEALDPA